MKRQPVARQIALQMALQAAIQMALPMTLALTTTKASAAALGGLTTSVGLFATLVALLAVKGWSQGWQAGVVASGTGALILALVGAALVWRARQRVASVAVGMLPWAGVAGFAGGPAPTATPASPRRATVDLPAGLECDALLAMARQHFVELQAAWDDGDIARLGALTTPDLLEDLCCQLPERGQGPNRTDVLTLHADLLGFEQWGTAYLASIEFSGMIREASHQGAVPFRELWMMTQPLGAESPWRLARQQALL